MNQNLVNEFSELKSDSDEEKRKKLNNNSNTKQQQQQDDLDDYVNELNNQNFDSGNNLNQFKFIQITENSRQTSCRDIYSQQQDQINSCQSIDIFHDQQDDSPEKLKTPQRLLQLTVLLEVWKNDDNINVLSFEYLSKLIFFYVDFHIGKFEIMPEYQIISDSYPIIGNFLLKFNIPDDIDLIPKKYKDQPTKIVREPKFMYQVAENPLAIQILFHFKEQTENDLEQLQLNKIDSNIYFNQFREDYQDLALISQKGVNSNKFGIIKLIKKVRPPDLGKIFVLKQIENITTKEAKQIDKFFQDGLIDDENVTGSNNIMREMKFLYDIKQMNIQHKNFIKFEKCVYNKKKYSIYFILEYFGGSDFRLCNLHTFFTKGQHFDLWTQGEQHLQQNLILSKKVIQNIFLQVLDAVQFFHEHNNCLRDLKEDNILIRRRENRNFEIALCDFGMSGILQKSMSLGDFCANEYRDPSITGNKYVKDQILYDARYDIYSLGILLKRLFTLFFYPFKEDFFFEYMQWDEYHQRVYTEIVANYFQTEKEIIEILTGDFNSVRPRNIKEVKQIINKKWNLDSLVDK